MPIHECGDRLVSPTVVSHFDLHAQLLARTVHIMSDCMRYAAVLLSQIALACSVLFAATLPPAHAHEVNSTVVAVSDGDTISVQDLDGRVHVVRLASIDAPERGHAFGRKAKEHLHLIVQSRQVLVRWNKRDAYQRLVGTVHTPDPGCGTPDCLKNVDVTLAQMEKGLAWWFRRYAGEQRRSDAARYEQAETLAKAQRLRI